MKPTEYVKRLAVGLVVLTLVSAGGIAYSTATDEATPEIGSLTVAAYSGEEAVASVPTETGAIELSANATGEVVLIDASHGNAIDREQLAPMIAALTRNGAEVRFLGAEERRRGPGEGSAFNASLRQADAFVTFGPQRQYTQSQVNGLSAFADAGGRVLIAKEPAQMQPTLVIFGLPQRAESPALPLPAVMSRFGMSFGSGYLYNMHQYDTNYRNVYATPAGNGHLTADVDRLVFHEATSVDGPETVVQTTDRTELSATRASGQYSVVARSGNVTAIGDSSVLGQEYYRRADNEVFVGNVLDFLISGEKSPENAPAPPETENEPPTQLPPR